MNWYFTDLLVYNFAYFMVALLSKGLSKYISCILLIGIMVNKTFDYIGEISTSDNNAYQNKGDKR